MDLSVLGSAVYNSEDMGATQVSLSRWPDTEDVVQKHDGMLFSYAKDETMPFAATWIDREGSMSSGVSQTEKEKRIVSVWNLKYDRDECVYKQE